MFMLLFGLLRLFSFLKISPAYNIATGNAPLTEEQPPPVVKKNENRKRHREPELSSNPKYDVGYSDGPMSHQDYIERRRYAEMFNS